MLLLDLLHMDRVRRSRHHSLENRHIAGRSNRLLGGRKEIHHTRRHVRLLGRLLHRMMVLLLLLLLRRLMWWRWPKIHIDL
jgi:hypothetical protein